MKVLHVYRTYYPDTQGGLEEAIRQICIGTGALGIENRVLTLQREDGEANVNRPEAGVFRSPRHLSIKSCDMGFKVLPIYKELLDWCDLVHYHFPWPFADLLELIAGGSKPYIVTYHSDVVRQKVINFFYRPLMTRFLTNAKRIIATSQNYVASSPVLNQYSEKVSVIPLGMDEHSYPDADSSINESVKQQYGDNFFVFIGVLRYYKGLHILLDAMSGADYSVVIAGSGPEEKSLKRQAQQLQLKNVFFAGFVSDEEKVALIQQSKGVIFPSHLRSEAFGVTLLEGAMLKRPLVSTEIGTGTSYVNIDKETGLVVSPSSPIELRAAMDYLHGNAEEAEAMGLRARLRFEAHFTSDITGEQYVRVYHDVFDELTQNNADIK